MERREFLRQAAVGAADEGLRWAGVIGQGANRRADIAHTLLIGHESAGGRASSR